MFNWISGRPNGQFPWKRYILCVHRTCNNVIRLTNYNLSRPPRTFVEVKAVSVICAQKLKYHYIVILPQNTQYCTLVLMIANFRMSRIKSIYVWAHVVFDSKRTARGSKNECDENVSSSFSNHHPCHRPTC